MAVAGHEVDQEGEVEVGVEEGEVDEVEEVGEVVATSSIEVVFALVAATKSSIVKE